MPVVQFLLWLLLVWGAGWLFFPVSRRFFETILPDSGLAVGRILFIALWTLCAFWLGFAHVPVVWSAGLYGVFALVGGRMWLQERAALRETIHRHRHGIVGVEVVFLAVFLFFFILRGFWSDTSGTNGEKGMDSGLIAAITRATYLPPPNIYAAGSRLQSYYYTGPLSAALLTRAALVPTRWSYNWMCATIPALCFSTLFALGAALTGRLRGGAFVTASVLTLGTLEPIYQWMRQRVGMDLHPNSFAHLDFFAVSRVIPYTINEFPWFTFNQADLHAHYFAFSLQIAMMTLAWGLFRRFSKRLALLTTLVLGTLVLTNVWDFPMYWLLVVLAMVVSRRESVLKRLGIGAGVAVGAIALALPFLLLLKTPATGPHLLAQPASPMREWLLLWGPMLAAWWLFSAKFIVTEGSGAKFWRLLFGVAAAWMGYECVKPGVDWALSTSPTAFLTPQAPPVVFSSWLVLPIIVGSMLLALLGIPRLRSEYRFICVLACAGLAAMLWSETTWAGFLGDPTNPKLTDNIRQDTVFKFTLQSWFMWGTASIAGLWLMLSRLRIWKKALIVGAYAPFVAVMLVGSLAIVLGRTHIELGGIPITLGGNPIIVGNTELQRPTIAAPQIDHWDSWARMEPPEKEAADWLQATVPPNEFILEAEPKLGGDYSESPRYANTTGIPTVIGPQAHSFYWCPANATDKDPGKKAGKEWDAVFKRKADARTIYTTHDVKEREKLLTQYHIRYVVWGQLERAEYPDSTLETLQPSHLQSAKLFGNPNDPRSVQIYEFDPSDDSLF